MPSPRRALDEPPELPARLGVEAGGRLVQEEQLRVGRRCRAPRPAGGAGRRTAARAGVAACSVEADQLDRSRPGRAGPGSSAAKCAHHSRRTRELGEVAGGLQHDAEPGSPGRPRRARVDAEHAHLAAVPPAVALEDLDRRRLARAVRAEQGEHLAAAHVQVDAVDGRDATVHFPQSTHADRGVRGRGHAGRVRPVGGVAGHGTRVNRRRRLRLDRPGDCPPPLIGGGPARAAGSEQLEPVVLDAAQRVVVEGHAADAAVGGQHPSLRLDLLGGEDAAHRARCGSRLSRSR